MTSNLIFFFWKPHDWTLVLLSVQLVMNVPFVAVHLAVYESAKKVMSGHKEESLAVQLLAGGTAGGTAAALTNPLDMVKTRLQLEGVNSATKYRTTHVVSSQASPNLDLCRDLNRVSSPSSGPSRKYILARMLWPALG